MEKRVLPFKTPGQKLIDAAREALDVARGETQPHKVHFVKVEAPKEKT